MERNLPLETIIIKTAKAKTSHITIEANLIKIVSVEIQMNRKKPNSMP